MFLSGVLDAAFIQHRQSAMMKWLRSLSAIAPDLEAAKRLSIRLPRLVVNSVQDMESWSPLVC